jgi:hypothetical protein
VPEPTQPDAGVDAGPGVDPIATLTLARLYVEQGHIERARRTLDAVLASDPDHAVAALLRERLRRRPLGSVTVRPASDPGYGGDGSSGRIAIAWRQLPSLDDGVIELRRFRRDPTAPPGAAPPVDVLRFPCTTRAGSLHLDAGPGPAACAVAIGRDGPAGFEPVAIAEALAW